MSLGIAINNGRVIELTEYRTSLIESGSLTEEEAVRLHRDFGEKFRIEFPSAINGKRYGITPLGWVGFIPITAELALSLRPKCPIHNLFRMLEYAYDLGSFTESGHFRCDSIHEFFDRLAALLIGQVSHRILRGLYRTYISYQEPLALVRGRILFASALGRPGDVRLECEYEEQTVDVPENQILLWTLHQIGRSGLCSEETRRRVHQTCRAFSGAVTLRPFTGIDCQGWTYNRLNEDYRPLHALCRFFLDQLGPTFQSGSRSMVPFLIDMNRLFERFVANWLRSHLPSHMGLETQEKLTLDSTGRMNAYIDLVLYDKTTGQARCVLDTKYKLPEHIANADIYQVGYYAEAKRCREGVLIYPQNPPMELEARPGGVRVRALAFDLSGDLEQAGERLVERLLSLG